MKKKKSRATVFYYWNGNRVNYEWKINPANPAKGETSIAAFVPINKRYADNGEPVNDLNVRRCPKCKEYPTIEGYDFCLQKLPGVRAACCGHGVEEGMVVFANGVTIHGKFGHLFDK